MKQKLIALLMVLSLCLSLLAGCGEKVDPTDAPTDAPKQTEATQDDKATEAPATDPVPAEPDKLTIWIAENLKVEDWETNAQTLWLEENGNFDLEFVSLASSDYETKVSMALTVGKIEELPDVIIGSFDNVGLWEYAQAETIVPLTEYYADQEKSPNIHGQIEGAGYDYTKTLYLPDGNVYSVATFNQSYANEYPHKIWIYKPWLDALGEDIPTTTEELYQLLKKVKETDLNGNGKHDEIPVLGDTDTYKGYFSALMNSFEYAEGLDGTNFTDDGEVYAAFATEAWKDGLAYITKLFDEDLIISEALTMDTAQAKTLLTGEEQLVFAFVTFTPISGNPNSDNWISILPVEGPDGVRWASYMQTTASSRFVVTANCKNVDAAFRLGDLLSSVSIGIQSRFGKEGVDWAYAENMDITGMVPTVDGFDPSIVMLDGDSNWKAQLQNNCWRQSGVYVRTYGIANGRMLDPATVTIFNKLSYDSQKMYQDAALHPKYDPSQLIFNEEELEVLADIEETLEKYRAEFQANVLAGNIDLDKEWDNYLAELDKIGLDEWLSAYQDAFDRAYK